MLDDVSNEFFFFLLFYKYKIQTDIIWRTALLYLMLFFYVSASVCSKLLILFHLGKEALTVPLWISLQEYPGMCV